MALLPLACSRVTPRIERGAHSPGYGQIEPAQIVGFCAAATLPFETTLLLLPMDDRLHEELP
jgi:hypothetical protein